MPIDVKIITDNSSITPGIKAPIRQNVTPQKYSETIKGEDGISATHEWNGTVLTITSASGTSSADLKGEKGDRGDTGRQGIPGKDGTDGKDGANGKDGINGKDGYTPIKGVDYKDGIDGKNGTNGTNGKDGISATHSWNGTILTITSASGTSSANLKGEKGEKGEDGKMSFEELTPEQKEELRGPQGIPGKDGADGKDGLNGKDGQNGKDGYTPVKGIDYFDGANGKDGTNGKDGANGKDGYTPVKGVDYFDGAPGPQGPAGYTPVKDVDYFDGKDGKDGKDGSDAEVYYFPITEDIVTVTTDDNKGVAPYSTSYGYTNIEIDKDAGVRWVEGGLYAFIVNTKMVVGSSYRNVRVRIGGDADGDVWHPLFSTSAILAGNSYLVKAYNTTFQYKTVYREEGALHLQTDSNTTYAYLVNTILGDATDAPLSIDTKGYGARYSLIFPTKPLSESLTGEVYSSIVASSSTGTTKKAVTVPKLYLDRKPLYVYSANVAAGTKPVNSLYQNYNAMDLRYTVNTSATYLTRTRRVFMYLHNFNPSDMSFVPDATVGNIMTIDKIATRFPATVKGDIYLYLLGWTQANWYALSPVFSNEIQLYKYTPSTGVLKPYVPTYYY